MLDGLSVQLVHAGNTANEGTMIRSEKLVWYRHNGGKQEVEEDRLVPEQGQASRRLVIP